MSLHNETPLVDIHCHLLPGIDDGPASWEDALTMAQMAAADGITVVVATPHQLGSYQRNRSDTIRDLVRRFQERLDENGIGLQVLPGADVRIEPDFVRRIRRDEVLTLADGGRYVLLELPHEVYLPLDRLIAELKAAGLTGVLSHPERNLGILERPQIAGRLVGADCLMQVTAGSLMGAFGAEIKQCAETLVREGLVHFLATDAHGPNSRRPRMSHAFARVEELAGRRAAYEMCCLNPACVVAGREVASGRRPVERRRAKGWLPWRKAG